MYFTKQLPMVMALVALVFGLVAVVPVQDADAQDRSRGKTQATIAITQVEGLCVYEVVGEADQDVFYVKPNAKIEFTTVDTAARVIISAQPTDSVRVGGRRHKGAKGVRSDQSANFTMPADTTFIRNSRARFTGPGRHDTSHKVLIFCMNEDGSENAATDKASILTNEQIGQVWQGDAEGALTGPTADMPQEMMLPRAVQGPGGPVMEVEDP